MTALLNSVVCKENTLKTIYFWDHRKFKRYHKNQANNESNMLIRNIFFFFVGGVGGNTRVSTKITLIRQERTVRAMKQHTFIHIY